MKNVVKLIVVSIMTSGVVGCGGSSDSGSTPPLTNTKVGIFVDAPVQGLSYTTPTQSGFTDAMGQFIYKDGEEVEFRVGNLLLGSGKGREFMTPYNISDSNATATNIALVLQNFDKDRGDAILNIAALKEYNLSDFNLSDTHENLESKLATLLASVNFQRDRGGVEFGLLDTNAVKSAMDNYIDIHSLKYNKKFTQAYLDSVDFYQAEQGSNYRVRFRETKRQIIGESDSTQSGGFNATFENSQIVSDDFVLEDGAIVMSFVEDGQRYRVATTVIATSETSITTLETVLESEIQKYPVGLSKSKIWYTSKEAAVANTISTQSGFGAEWLQRNTLYTPIYDDGTKFVAEMKFKNGKRSLPDGSSAPYEINQNGWIEVTERDGYKQVTKIVDINGSRVDVITGSLSEVRNNSADRGVYFTSKSDAEAYLSTLVKNVLSTL